MKAWLATVSIALSSGLLPLVAAAQGADPGTSPASSALPSTLSPTPPASTSAAVLPPASTAVAASTNPGQQELESVRKYTVPDAPALIQIGSTATIDRPSSPSKFALALANLVTPSGALRSGVAVEASLRGLGLYEPANWYQYRTQFWARFLTRAALSVATASDAATTSTPAAARFGVGLRLVFWDDTDPLLDTSYKQAVDAARASCPDAADLDCRQRVFNQYDKWKPIRWNAGGFAIAAAFSEVFAESKVKDGKAEAASAWATLAVGAGSIFHISVSGLYRRHFIESRHAFGGSARIRLGGEDIRALIEGSYVNVGLPEAAGKRGRAGVGAEARLSSTTWFSATMGGDFEGNDSPLTVFVFSNLKYAFTDKPSLW